MTIEQVLDQFSREVHPGPIVTAPGTDLCNVPNELQDLYRVCNGLLLPFVEIYPADRLTEMPGLPPEWRCFGFDGFFSYCLVGPSGIDLWDHESGCEPECSFEKVEDLLLECFRMSVEESDLDGVVVASSFESVALGRIAPILKGPLGIPSDQLLSQLKQLPMRVTTKRRVGIEIVRQMQELGVHCRLELS